MVINCQIARCSVCVVQIAPYNMQREAIIDEQRKEIDSLRSEIDHLRDENRQLEADHQSKVGLY